MPRQLVIPGEMIASEPVRLDNTYVENGKTFAKVLGFYESEKRQVIPLEGIWQPRIGDIVVGIVVNARNAVYEIDLSHFTRSILIGSKFDRQAYKPGDVIEAEVKDIEDRKTLILWRPRVLFGGTILEVRPTKVPRIIGKANTMIEQISKLTKCNISVGNNGIIWLKGADVPLATEAIRKIEDEAHLPGLTEKIKQMLEEKTQTQTTSK